MCAVSYSEKKGRYLRPGNRVERNEDRLTLLNVEKAEVSNCHDPKFRKVLFTHKANSPPTRNVVRFCNILDFQNNQLEYHELHYIQIKPWNCFTGRHSEDVRKLFWRATEVNNGSGFISNISRQPVLNTELVSWAAMT